MGPIDFASEKSFLVLCIVVLAIVGARACGFRRNDRTFLDTLRGSPTAAASVGISATRWRITAFTLSAAIAGIGGACSRCGSSRRLQRELRRPTRAGMGRRGRVARYPVPSRARSRLDRLHVLPAGRARGLDPMDLQPRVRSAAVLLIACDHRASDGHPQVRGAGIIAAVVAESLRAVLPRSAIRAGRSTPSHRPRDGVLRLRSDNVRPAPRRDPRAQQAGVARAARNVAR